MSADAASAADPDDDVVVAAEFLEARLEPGPRRPIRHAIRMIGAVALAAVGADGSDLGRESQLVVRRIGTGREVLRTDAGAIVEADTLLQRVRLDLEQLTVAEFVAEWRLMGATDA
jgi:hypothetical protein